MPEADSAVLNLSARASIRAEMSAMPVILTTAEEIETCMTEPATEALKLQRPLPDGVLCIVARAEKKDGE
jgi:hypothetical protein